jgi:putative membrane protein
MCEKESEDTPMMWGYGFSWGGMFLMLLGTAFWVALLVVLVWALIRWLDRRNTVTSTQEPHMPASGPSALEILRQRYARGEIDTATFEQMRERLVASGAREDQQESGMR